MRWKLGEFLIDGGVVREVKEDWDGINLVWILNFGVMNVKLCDW